MTIAKGQTPLTASLLAPRHYLDPVVEKLCGREPITKTILPKMF
jgi:hypothetical protein